MRWGSLLLGITLVMILLPLVSGYVFDYYLSDTGTATEIEQGVNFDGIDYCNFTVRSYYDNGSLPVTTEFYEPYDDYDIYADTSNSGNCAFGGKRNFNNDLDGLFEHEIQHDNVTNGYQVISVSCDPGSDFLIEIDPTTLDSENYYSGMFRKSGGAVYPPVALKTFNNATYIPDTCYKDTFTRHYNQSSCSPVCNEYSWTPFVAGYNQTEFQISATGHGAAVSMRVIVYSFNDTATELYNNFQESATVSWDFNLTTLNPNETYVVETATYVVNPSARYNFTEFSIINVDAAPNWSCSTWSACDTETDTQERTCIDTNGIVEDYLEYRTCVAAPGEFDDFVYIGWRNLTAYEVPVCIPNWTITGCTNYVVNKTVYMPTDWELVTEETLADNLAGQYPYRLQSWIDLDGFKFRMWNRPPKPNEARYNSGWECINQTSFSPTWETKNISNSSMSAEFNITFPEDNMQVWFTTRKCDEQQHQYTHEDSASWFGVNCGELCYSGSCSDDVRGGYLFQITDMSTMQEVFRYNGEAVSEWRSYYFDISDAALEAGTTYRLQISAYDPDFTTAGTCLEFWDFGYGISSGAFECTSYCDADTFHYFRATTTADGFCVYEDTGFSSDCVDNEYLPYIERCENYCDGDESYHIATNASGICYWDVIENADVCQDNISPETSLIPSNLASILDGYGLGIVNFLVSIASFIYIGMAIICFYAAQWFKPSAFLGILFIVLLLANGGYLPPFVLGVIAIGAFFLFARSVVDLYTGGNNTGGG